MFFLESRDESSEDYSSYDDLDNDAEGSSVDPKPYKKRRKKVVSPSKHVFKPLFYNVGSNP